MTLRHIISPQERRRRLKTLLSRKTLTRGIEVHNAIGALIINDLRVSTDKGEQEFDFFWSSSLTDSASKGYPDIEIVSFDSRLRTISEILECTDKPIIVDGDTGGDIHHFEYLIPKLESKGVSAIIIEDKVFPKRNSLEEGTNQTLEDPDLFAKKIQIGKRIQQSEDFMIIARIEALIAGFSVQEALRRARTYLEAGVDGIMIHSKDSSPDSVFTFSEQYQQLCNELGIHRPLVCVPTTYNTVKEEELYARGFSVAIYANHLLRASYKAMERAATSILLHQRSYELTPDLTPVRDIFDKVGFLDVKEKDKHLHTFPPLILLSAGHNPELRSFLGDLPKPLMKIGNKTVLEHQIESFHKVGIKDINAIIGYNKDLFPPHYPVTYYHNDSYQSGVLRSLFSAKEKMSQGFLYMNGDNLVDEKLLRDLLGVKDDITLVVDNSYMHHQHEVNKRLDAVITRKGVQPTYQRLRNLNDEVLVIGKSIPREKMTHEYVGIGRFSKTGARILQETYEDVLQNHQGPFHEARSIDEAMDTDLFQELIRRGVRISVLETNGGWLELHNEKDFTTAQNVLTQFLGSN